MARLNLICNGMMLFNEIDSQHIQIIIPNIEGHVRRICTDMKPALDKLVPLNIGSYRLTGPDATNTLLRTLICPDRYLVMKKSAVALDQIAAAAVSAIFLVPKPSLVRLFRASEPTGNVFGNTPLSATHGKPTIHHDVVVLSYVGLPAGKNLALSNVDGTVLGSATAVSDEVINWVLYSTEAAPMSGGVAPHPTALNDLLTFNGSHTDFSLSAIGPKDGLHSTGIGMSTHHLAAIHELPPTALGSVIELNSGDMGCSGGAIGD